MANIQINTCDKTSNLCAVNLVNDFIVSNVRRENGEYQYTQTLRVDGLIYTVEEERPKNNEHVFDCVFNIRYGRDD